MTAQKVEELSQPSNIASLNLHVTRSRWADIELDALRKHVGDAE